MSITYSWSISTPKLYLWAHAACGGHLLIYHNSPPYSVQPWETTLNFYEMSFFLDPTCKIMCGFPFCAWLISLNTMSFSSNHIVTNDRILHFYGWIVLDYVYALYSLYPFISWWVLRLFPFLAVTNSATINRGSHVDVVISFHLAI